jgi:low affinity Fe/Cu permease
VERAPENENGGTDRTLNGLFDHFASRMATWTGRSVVFLAAVAITIVWAITGPLFHFSNGWQLVINTGTTVLTFLMVFVIQNSMNRESAALHLKLDELIKATAEAHDEVRGAEKLTEDEISALSRKV